MPPMKLMIPVTTMRMTSEPLIGRSQSSNSGQGDSCLEKGWNMEPMVMTAEELRAYLRSLPDDVILRVTVQEGSDEPDRTEKV